MKIKWVNKLRNCKAHICSLDSRFEPILVGAVPFEFAESRDLSRLPMERRFLNAPALVFYFFIAFRGLLDNAEQFR